MANAALNALLAKIAARSTSIPAASPQTVELKPIAAALAETAMIHPIHKTQLSAKQAEFVNLLKEGKEAILIGAAGTGKTYTVQAALYALLQSGCIPMYEDDGHKHLKNAAHGILILSYTRRAVANIKKNLPTDLQANCMTIHAALEYQPEYFEVEDPVTGEWKNTMRFAPRRTVVNPLSSSIKYIIIEESSMVGTDLFQLLKDACDPRTKFIFLGDINQLPPVFGPAILGYKMCEIPVVELTDVYRQALESPIISLAHAILQQKEIALTPSDCTKLHFKVIQKKVHADHLIDRVAAHLCREIAEFKLDPEQDIILCPFNKGLGTIELNKFIAQYLTQQRGERTYEVIAGFNKHYLAVGDKVMYEKEDARIISINRNAQYLGSKIPQAASITLDRWGYDSSFGVDSDIDSDDFNVGLDVDAILASLSSPDSGEERKNAASHCITVEMRDTGEQITLDKAAEINALMLGYALTVHKSQGSEWRKVYCIFHNSHATMLSQELLYTAVTRAKEELFIICEKDTFLKGVRRQRYPGKTWLEKREYFKGRIEVEATA